jgi:son of sevenless-like protein
MLISHSDNIYAVDDLTKNKWDRSVRAQMVTSISNPPASIYPTNPRPGLLDINALELARQLTILASLLYLSVKPMECLQRSSEAQANRNDSISRLTQHYNRVRVNHVG